MEFPHLGQERSGMALRALFLSFRSLCLFWFRFTTVLASAFTRSEHGRSRPVRAMILGSLSFYTSVPEQKRH